MNENWQVLNSEENDDGQIMTVVAQRIDGDIELRVHMTYDDWDDRKQCEKPAETCYQSAGSVAIVGGRNQGHLHPKWFGEIGGAFALAAEMMGCRNTYDEFMAKGRR